MPLFYLRRLTGKRRTEKSNRHLAGYLAFVAGATNAGGFLAVHQYTSHMTGIVSAMADNLAAGSVSVAVAGFSAMLSFLCGAFLTTLFVRWAHSRNLESVYALPLILEAFLLVIFGLTGSVFTGGGVLGTILLLCFTMGLQNAIVTKLSNAVIRTTHLTGMITDIGIALGRIISARMNRANEALEADARHLRLLTSLVALFFLGGLTGTLGFQRLGFLFTLPLAGILFVLALVPALHDLQQRPTAGNRVRS